MFKKLLILCFFSVLASQIVSADSGSELLKARDSFKTQITEPKTDEYTFDKPPADFIKIVDYSTELGNMKAYLTTPRQQEPEKKYPAIIWITGGFPPGGGSASLWESQSFENDQSAQSYWLADIVSMYPAFRGSYSNPGHYEGFYGEVNDALAALKYVQQLDYVDPSRIYLGGHSTGGTLALLVAASSDAWAGVFAFGPVADPAGYGDQYQRHSGKDDKESYLRAPLNFINSIKVPTFVIEGSEGNAGALTTLEKSSTNKNLRFITIEGADHFDTLYSSNNLIAKLMKDSEQRHLSLDKAMLQTAYDNERLKQRELQDLHVLAEARQHVVSLEGIKQVNYYLLAKQESALSASIGELKKLGFMQREIKPIQAKDGETYHLMTLEKSLDLTDLKQVFLNSSTLLNFANTHELYYQYWDLKE